MSIKFLVLGGGYFGLGGGGGSADFIFMGAGIFLNLCPNQTQDFDPAANDLNLKHVGTLPGSVGTALRRNLVKRKTLKGTLSQTDGEPATHSPKGCRIWR